MADKSIFVISDIHGCLQEFNELLAKLPIKTNSQFVFLGDYIDRGPHSAGVIDRILKLKESYEVVALAGNHEQMLMHFLEDKSTPEAASFVINGGGATLASYSDSLGDYQMPEEHMDFLKSLKLCHEMDDDFFVHAGVPDVPLTKLHKKKYESEMLWIRKPFFYSSYNWGKRIFHGHTPVKECTIGEKRVNVDTGCVYGNKLTALMLPEMETFCVEKTEPLVNLCLIHEGSNRRAERFEVNLPVHIKSIHGESVYKSVDYSECGVFVRESQQSREFLYSTGDVVSGTIGINSMESVPFEGVVVRYQKKAVGAFFAIEFTMTPFELLYQNGEESLPAE
ncbi:MAG: metallophosphoesterase [Planctomycetes bacterium]|nr:metallophosphoesterase [Planctomycetota bacterium]